jgi:hypothetical protein
VRSADLGCTGQRARTDAGMYTAAEYPNRATRADRRGGGTPRYRKPPHSMAGMVPTVPKMNAAANDMSVKS